MFPSVLDNAKVLYYTSKDNYGVIRWPDGETADAYGYLAICKYENDENYYLFCCDANYEVVTDAAWESIEKCIQVASAYKENIAWIKMTDTD